MFLKDKCGKTRYRGIPFVDSTVHVTSFGCFFDVYCFLQSIAEHEFVLINFLWYENLALFFGHNVVAQF